ncbi:MAG TPA: hypothetical protein DHU55_07775 [Blastocatellia bacterium]|jgi:hypothetical protein|nr:hypothetical protein [Blastocatellia bacterium]HCX29655.1 hypothetical protein [Blastocatellia bacterium]
MALVMYVIAIALVAIGLFLVVRFFVRGCIRYRESRIITCPDTGEAVMVEVDAVHAALTSLAGAPDIRLRNCRRWPINENCGQECLTQLDVAPPECLVSAVLRRWYDSKQCIYCGKPFQHIQLTDHKPALQSPDGELVEWRQVPIENISIVMDTYSPVCWDCYVAQSFRRDHPELVVYRPWREGIHRADHADR